jgi:hypothetical protein
MTHVVEEVRGVIKGGSTPVGSSLETVDRRSVTA